MARLKLFILARNDRAHITHSAQVTLLIMINIPVLRMNMGTMCIYDMRVSSYSKVNAVEQRYVVNSGARGTKQERRLNSGPRLVVSDIIT